ncbi:MAG TPA: hypothetical protein VHS78_10575 [Candidatus Elarobacter sp.]|jgi:hypothetical protein|nr:hypothetical protein [Candidatus Elarobacter sp.]
MHVRALSVAALASTVVLAACGGGGGTGAAPAAPAPPVVTAAPAVPAATGSVPMTITIPHHSPSSSARAPQFISPDAAAMAIYDGAALVYVANLSLDSQTPFATVYSKSGSTTVTPGTCTFSSSTATCTLSITATTGAHKFDVVIYPQAQGQQPNSAARKPADVGTVPVFAGVISSEGELSVTIAVGTNPAATLTLLGVADRALFAGASEAAYNATATYGYRIQDSTGVQIVQPGTAYDNGPVTFTAAPAGIVTITPSSVSTPPASAGDQNFNVQCINTAGGTVTITIGAKTQPNTTYADGLAYSSSNYSSGTITSFPFTCDAATGTIPVTVQGTRRQ